MSGSVPYQRSEKSLPWFPAALDEERAALGACLLGQADKAVELLAISDFSTESHKNIFAAIVKLVAEGETALEVSLVAGELRRRGELDRVGGDAYLVALLEGVVKARKMESRARALRELAERRKLLHVAEEVSRRSRDYSVSISATAAWLRGEIS